MKTINLLKGSTYAAICCLFLMVSSCRKDHVPEISAATIAVEMSFDEDHSYLKASDLEVNLKNTQSGRVYTAKTDSEGKVTFADMPVGLYDVSSLVRFSAEEYQALTGLAAIDSVLFNASQPNVSIQPADVNRVVLTLRTGGTSTLVIKQFYYAGSNFQKAAGTNDIFLEIYNNSANVVYADSLCISLLHGSRSLNGSDTRFAYQENGNLDWSKSVGMPANIKANEDYVYAANIYMIPGGGKDHPIAPGNSIVIARSALNFKGGYTNQRGEIFNPIDPSLTLDLSNADFEANHVPFAQDPLQSRDTENPSVKDLIVKARANAIDFLPDRYGKEAIIIWRMSGDIGALPRYHRPLSRPGAYTDFEEFFATQVPHKYIVDALELQPSDGSRSAKRIPSIYDAGYMYNTSGEYTSESVIRKTLRVVNGRRILQDTNNSTNDFVTIKANPKGFAD